MFQRGTNSATTVSMGNRHVENWAEDSQHTEDTCTDIDTDDKNQVGLYRILGILLIWKVFITKAKIHFFGYSFCFFVF